MLSKKMAVTMLAMAFVICSVCVSSRAASMDSAQTLEDNWGDFVHYITIGRFDLAKGYAQLILDGNPDPVELLEISRKNQQGYQVLLRVKDTAPDAELVDLSSKILAIIEQGRFEQRINPAIIAEEVRRLSSTERGWFTAVKRLRDAGEYAIPFMLDALSDSSREQEFPYIIRALPQVGKDAIRPLAAALQTNDVGLKSEIIKALGKIGYPQSEPYLKYIIEKDGSMELRQIATQSIMQIDPDALKIPAAQLFYQLAEKYYYHSDSLEPTQDADFGNIWFWDAEAGELTRTEVDISYFYELMAMRSCEWALRADAEFGSAIGLWLAAFFKAESYGIPMPDYFGERHADASVYATTAGVEYLHQALARAVRDGNAYVALGVVEALSTTAGEKSLMYRIGTVQPLAQALNFNNRMVRYSAAIAIGLAGPMEPFPESRIVIANLAEALSQPTTESVEQGLVWNQEVADSYATRAADVMYQLAVTRNPVIDLSLAQSALIKATSDRRIQVTVCKILAHINSPDAQRTIAAMAFDTSNELSVRIDAFDALATSAKLNANMLTDSMVNDIYELIRSGDADPDLRSAAAAAYGALDLPSEKAKDLILDQAKS